MATALKPQAQDRISNKVDIFGSINLTPKYISKLVHTQASPNSHSVCSCERNLRNMSINSMKTAIMIHLISVSLLSQHIPVTLGNKLPPEYNGVKHLFVMLITLRVMNSNRAERRWFFSAL